MGRARLAPAARGIGLTGEGGAASAAGDVSTAGTSTSATKGIVPRFAPSWKTAREQKDQTAEDERENEQDEPVHQRRFFRVHGFGSDAALVNGYSVRKRKHQGGGKVAAEKRSAKTPARRFAHGSLTLSRAKTPWAVQRERVRRVCAASCGPTIRRPR